MIPLFPLLQDLVAIDSVSPTLAGGPGEEAAARWCAEWLRAAGLAPVLQEVSPGRPNVIARVPGRGEAAPLLLNVHLDTVGGCGMTAPLVLRQDGDRLYGRGTYDMKGSAAVLLALGDFFLSAPPPGDLWLTFVVDEEDRSIGMEALIRDWLPTLDEPPAGAVVLEPTEEEIGIAHRGFVWFELTVQGKAAHGSMPEAGVDAILPLGAALNELATIRAALESSSPEPLLGTPSLHISMISGGSAWSIYPADAALCWERRTLPGADEEQARGELRRVVMVTERTTTGAVQGAEIFSRSPLGTPPDSALVRSLRAVLPEAKLAGLPFWTDGALLSEAGVSTVIFGPKGHGAHADDEWVSAASLERLFQTMRALIESGAWGG